MHQRFYHQHHRWQHGDAKSIIRKYNKALRNSDTSDTKVRLPVLKKMCCYINNQNFRINVDIYLNKRDMVQLNQYINRHFRK